MRSSFHSPVPLSSLQTCYFSITPSPSSHFSVETPIATPVSAYSPDTFADPSNPLLAYRGVTTEPGSTPVLMDASKLLQRQTAAAHSRPGPQPMQHSGSAASNMSSASSSTPASSNAADHPLLCCSRCRRTSAGLSGMVKFGTNLWYCNHCASMVGYGAG